ncbi:MAG: L-threonylcarbamoyladenylate synthase [Gemmatimonadaceae bacterium]
MRVIHVNAQAPERSALREAAELLRGGGLVAFPTETVYGLGANALDANAVDRIYQAKGRPPINPLIVHVSTIAEARALTTNWTLAADRLAGAYWPGPITLVVRKAAHIPDIVTAGGDTVGLRVPGHPVALALIEMAGVPIAAPSANRSNQVSPTTAQHVARGLAGRVDLVIDAGATTIGIESTVVDATGDVPRILRPGMITRDAVARVAGSAEIAATASAGAPRSPGLLERHYAPGARVVLFTPASRDAVMGDARVALDMGRRVGGMLFGGSEQTLTLQVTMPADPDGYARALYAALHQMDDAECDAVLIELPPDTAAWAGVMDRLRRAAA